jgi:hypothetical protein
MIKEILATRSRESIQKHFFVHKGPLTQKQRDQLIAYTQVDQLVEEFDTDRERFSSRETYESWISTKPRIFYTLTDSYEPDGKLYGIIWFGEKVIPSDYCYILSIKTDDYPYTIGTRIYDEARGLGLSKNFKWTVLTDFFNRNIPPFGVWSETSSKNDRNVRGNLNLGYKIATQPDTRGKIIMII